MKQEAPTSISRGSSLCRFYDIEEGVISVDGYDLTKVSIQSLRKQMGVMIQDNFIFHGTVRENILYGKLDATEEEMIAAADCICTNYGINAEDSDFG